MEVVTSLLAAEGIAVNRAARYSRLTPLRVAASKGHTDIVSALLTAGVDLPTLQAVASRHPHGTIGHLLCATLTLVRWSEVW